jgi:hypothetical protein
MVLFDNLTEQTLEYIRDILRNDTTLAVTILGLSGTTTAINHLFIGRPRDEKINKNSIPSFKLPRIVIDLIDGPKGRKGNNEDGVKTQTVQAQISHWTKNTSWSTSFKVNDRIGILLEDTKMPVTDGFSRFDIASAEVTDDPDRPQTKIGRMRVDTIVEKTV